MHEDRSIDPLGSGFGNNCDESKCVSRGMAHLYNDSFTCLGNGRNVPMMCADGFVPVTTNEDPVFVEKFGYNLTYHTCCPPHEASSNLTDATRHCSDPIPTDIDFGSYDDEDGHALCKDQGIRKYFRPMKPKVKKLFRGNVEPARLNQLRTNPETNSFLCCDSEKDDDEPTDTAPTYIDDVECVPYNDHFYISRNIRNSIGFVMPIVCDFPDGSFVFPRPIDNGVSNDIASTGRYQCCKNGPPLSPYIQDTAFNVTIYLPFTLWCLSAVTSTIVATALLIPLVMQRKHKRYPRNSLISQEISREGRQRRSSHMSGKSPPYSPDNLYLVYLAFLDLVFSFLNIICYLEAMNQKFRFSLYGPYVTTSTNEYSVTDPDELMTHPYICANMWINAILCRQVLLLLSTSQRVRRIKLPSVKKVNMQVGGAIFISAIYLCIHFVLRIASQKAGRNQDFEKVRRLGIVTVSFTVLVLSVPFLYVVYVIFLILRRGYMRSTNGGTSFDKSMRQLGFFLFRIVAVFIGIWIPYYVTFYFVGGRKQPWWFLVGSCIIAIQPMLSTCIILTKPDARMYILNLLTMSYCDLKKEQQEEKNNATFGTGKSSDSVSPEDDTNEDPEENRISNQTPN